MAEDQNDGVFGSLPRSRPSVRSPARDSRAAAEARRASKRTPDTRSQESQSAPGRDADQRAARGAELEDLARVGVTVASQAASLGLRLAGRAAGALRDAVERR